MEKIAIVLVAGGRGSRAGEGLPKQYRTVAGKPLIQHTLTTLKRALPDVLIQPVIHADDVELFGNTATSFDILSAVPGGKTRQDSVFAGLKALESHQPDFVLVHDAARPFVSQALIDGVLKKLKEGNKAVIPAFPIVDTLNRVEGGFVSDRVDRSNLYSVQTPQGFNYSDLFAAHIAHNGKDMTDDGAVMEAEGHKLVISDGDDNNFKVTLSSDLAKAEKNIMNRLSDIRVGSGYDVHRFEPGDSITLCGHTFDSDRSLKGHSDADVGLHALTDAILAAICEGDIGTHFPPSDIKWKGVESHVFLKYASKLVSDRAGVISHVTVCLICEKPKIGPHKDAMRNAIAAILDIDEGRISVQATTTEKLGFTGREEGIAAQATATVRLPL